MKTRQLLLILLTAVVLCRPCPGASIGIPSQAVVAGSQVTLADLHATVLASPANAAKIKAMVVAAAPLPGKSRTITKAQIREHLLQAGFNPDLIKLDCPDEIQITRSSNTIAGQEIIAAGVDYLRRQITVEKDNALMVLPITAPHDIVVPVGKVDLVAETTGAVSGKTSAVGSFARLVLKMGLTRFCVSWRISFSRHFCGSAGRLVPLLSLGRVRR